MDEFSSHRTCFKGRIDDLKDIYTVCSSNPAAEDKQEDDGMESDTSCCSEDSV